MTSRISLAPGPRALDPAPGSTAVLAIVSPSLTPGRLACGRDAGKGGERGPPRQQHRSVAGRVGPGGCDQVEVRPVGRGAVVAEPRLESFEGVAHVREIAARRMPREDRRGSLADGAGPHAHAEPDDLL